MKQKKISVTQRQGVELNQSEQPKEKRMKKNEDTLRHFGTTSSRPTFTL